MNMYFAQESSPASPMPGLYSEDHQIDSWPSIFSPQTTDTQLPTFNFQDDLNLMTHDFEKQMPTLFNAEPHPFMLSPLDDDLSTSFSFRVNNANQQLIHMMGNYQTHVLSPQMPYYKEKVTKPRQKRDLPSKFDCQSCTAVFKRRAELKRHVQSVHLKQQMYTCPSGCGASFSRKDAFKRHCLSRVVGKICAGSGKLKGNMNLMPNMTHSMAYMDSPQSLYSPYMDQRNDPSQSLYSPFIDQRTPSETEFHTSQF